jgi:hypothetical protein
LPSASNLLYNFTLGFSMSDDCLFIHILIISCYLCVIHTLFPSQWLIFSFSYSFSENVKVLNFDKVKFNIFSSMGHCSGSNERNLCLTQSLKYEFPFFTLTFSYFNHYIMIVQGVSLWYFHICVIMYSCLFNSSITLPLPPS